MNAETYTWTYLGLSTERMCGHSANTASNPTSFPLQGQPISDQGWTNSQSLGIPVRGQYRQLGAEARFVFGCGAPPLY
jgi:hypothetical protein